VSNVAASKFAYRFDELTKLLGIGRSTLYAEIKSGRLRRTKIGRRSLVLADDLAEYLASLQAASGTVVRQTSC
jgi:excisionase family DNA binding protein